MDVKQLQTVDGDGLEQWRPVMKARFPLPAADVRSLLAALGVEVPLAREVYTLDELVGEVIGASDSLRAVEVHKHREHHTLGGSMTEVTELRTPSGSIRTLAVESENQARVVATVRALELASRPNVCLARGLKNLVGFEAARYAVVDVGTNSVKFHIAERRPNGAWVTIVDRSEITRLGEGLADSGRLEPEPMARTLEAIAGMVAEAEETGVAGIAAVGTAALRIASNSADLVAAVRERCGLEIEVIPAEEEARLAYKAVISGLDLGQGSFVVFDTGGGSSQFTFGDAEGIREQFSVDVGAVRLTERFGLSGAVGRDVLDEALAATAAELARLDGRPSPDALAGLGGAVTNLAAVKHGLTTYDPDVVQGTVLDRAEIDRQLELYRTRTADERRLIAGLQPKRAEVILAGACVVRTVLTKLGRDSLTVSDRGLRHGLVAERFG
jgi:exopolyphosphatase/guanosine-5'-triphosphate,3'-diphosphate pyrophosphatase